MNAIVPLVFVVLFMVCLRELNAKFYFRGGIGLSVADPNAVQVSPLTAVLNREPRPCHKVDALNSQPSPQAMLPNSFNRPAGG